MVKLSQTSTIAPTILTTSTSTLPSPLISSSIEAQTCNISNVINLDETRTTNSSPGLQQSQTKVKRYSYLTTSECYFAREWEDEAFAIQNDYEFIKAEAKELNCDVPNLEIPKWIEHELTPSYCIEGTEDLFDDSFLKRHLKLEIDEKRRKKWDVQQIREQRRIERLKRRHCKEEINSSNTDATQLNSFYPMPDDVQTIHYTDELPVQAFGELIPRLNYGESSEELEFFLPWQMNKMNSSTEASLTGTCSNFASSVSSNLTSLPTFSTPLIINSDGNSSQSSEEQSSTFVFLKKKKLRQSSSTIINNNNLTSSAGSINSNNNKSNSSSFQNNVNQGGRHQRCTQSNKTMLENASSPTISTEDTEISNSISNNLSNETNLISPMIKELHDTIDGTSNRPTEGDDMTGFSNAQHINGNKRLEESALNTIKKEDIIIGSREEASTLDEKSN